MIKLHQFERYFGLPSASPFCMKVECWMRMAGIDYENVWVGDPSKLPKGKAPAIEHGGTMIADSTFIIDYLRLHFPCTLDEHLQLRDLAAAHAFERMLEERSYWVMVYSRWGDDRGWPELKPVFFANMPPVVRQIVPPMLRKRVMRDMRGHGIGRHSIEEIYSLGARDLQAISDWLGDHDYFMGDTPSSIDAAVYAFVANALHSLRNPLAEAAESHANLAPYCERMRSRYFADIDAK